MPVIKHAEASSIAREAIVLDLGDLDREASRLREQAEVRAAEIITEAKAERERLISGADERGYAEGLERGRADGLKKGREAGREEALAAAKEEFAVLAARWEEALEAFSAARQGLLASARRDVVRLGAAIGEKVARRVIASDGEQVARSLEAALSVLLDPSRLVIRVHPDDAALTEEVLPSLTSRFASEPHAEIAEDATLTPGSCVVRTDRGEIDASIETMLGRVVDAVLEGISERTELLGSDPEAPADEAGAT
ncbi:MAG: FliH/SctL family protein [Planctomycetota bacterium]